MFSCSSLAASLSSVCPSVSAFNARSRSLSFCSTTHRVWNPIPLCPPTPALKSSSRLLTLHTSLGHRESFGLSGFPLKCATAHSRCASVSKFTNAQFERAMMNTEETPPHISTSRVTFSSLVAKGCDCTCREVGEIVVPGERDCVGAAWLKKFHSSSDVASDGTLPTHMTHSERLAGGFG